MTLFCIISNYLLEKLLKSKNGKSSDVDISRDASEAAAIMASQIISEFYPFETTSSHDTSKEIRNLMVNSATLILRLKECLADKLHARDLIKFSEALTPTMPSNLK